MIFLSAGHNNNDPGATGNGYIERDLTIELRGLIAAELKKHGSAFVLDNDSESLAQYIARIKPGSGSVVCEIHFNAAAPNATGAECLYPSAGAAISKAMATTIADTISNTLGIRNRGAKDEAESHRGRLGILRTKAGISCLPEICFITNASDMAAYQRNKGLLAKRIAAILVAYEAIY